MRSFVLAVLCLFTCFILAGCGGGTTEVQPPAASVSVQLSPSIVQIGHDGSSADVTARIYTAGDTGAVTIALSNVPAGVTATVLHPDTNTAKLTFTVTDAKQLAAKRYPVVVNATSAAASGNASLTLDVAALVNVAGAPGAVQAPFMSTSFQVASWSYTWLHDHPATLPPLAELAPQHIRLQLLNTVAPEISPGQWDFSKMDEMVQPVLAVGDQSPQFQIGNAPAFMYDGAGKFRDPSFAEFAEYCAQLVRYYNKGGFTANGRAYRSPAAIPITWWGIYNEPNINNVTPDEYVRMYNAVAAAMLAVDPDIKLVALELSDWGNEPQRFTPPFLAGVTQPVHVVATHYYGTCNQKDADQSVFTAVDYFVDHVKYLRSTLDASPATNGVPIWITENNVNADWNNNGKSACNGTSPFVADPRGSTAFAAAWRPYVYSQLAKAGMAGLWHWSYPGDVQYGEIKDNAEKQLSYWVDYYLSHLFASAPMNIVPMSTSDSRVEAFAASGADGKRVVMVVNREVATATDNNGLGVPKTVTLDVSPLGSYTSASLIAIDSTTDAANGPTWQTLTPAAKLKLSFPGYGVQFVRLQ